MNARNRQQLEHEGFLLLPEFFAGPRLSALRDRVEELYAQEGEAAGAEFRQEAHTRRLANLVNKGPVFAELIQDPQVLEYVSSVLGPRFKLSSLNARSANPNSASGQPLHADMGAIADDQGYFVCNTVWMLDNFTEQNGALRAIPGSHGWRRLPQDSLADLAAPHPDEVLVTGPAGSVVVMNAHMWHGGTDNRTGDPRRALHAFYCRWDKPQQQYQKKLLSADVQSAASSRMRELLALDDPLNDELSSMADRPSGFLK